MVKTTYRYIMDYCNWEKACDVLGWNPWMFNEGLACSDSECYLSFEQASKIGLSIDVN